MGNCRPGSVAIAQYLGHGNQTYSGGRDRGGFGAHVARSPEVTRFYLECPAGDTPENWPDDRVWAELHARLTTPDGPINDGRLFEKRVLDMHNYVTDLRSFIWGSTPTFKRLCPLRHERACALGILWCGGLDTGG